LKNIATSQMRRFRFLAPSSGRWSIFKTIRRSLNEVLYFALLLDRCLRHWSSSFRESDIPECQWQLCATIATMCATLSTSNYNSL
jgi:hypothetical protein